MTQTQSRIGTEGLAPAPASQRGLAALRHVGRALKHRNFRLFFAGQSVSLIGSWMQMIAMGWLVRRLTGSDLLLGAVIFASQIPMLLTPFMGIIVERYSQHRLLILSQTLMMIQAGVLAALTLGGVLSGISGFYVLVSLGIFSGLARALDVPTRQSFVVYMIDDREDLSNAIALNSVVFNLARVIGPTLAGFVIALLASRGVAQPEGWCFLANSVTFLAVIGSLLMMRIDGDRQPRHRGSVIRGLRQGFAYTAKHVPIRTTMLLLVAFSFASMGYNVLLLAFAKGVLKQEADVYGMMMAASGVGAFFGAIYLAARRGVRGLDWVLAFGPAAFGLALLGISQSTHYLQAVLLMIPAGASVLLFVASCNMTIQTLVDDERRGRVMALYSLAFLGLMPISNLTMGWLSEMLGTRVALMIAAAGCFLTSLAFIPHRRAFRRKADEMGDEAYAPDKEPAPPQSAAEPLPTRADEK